MATNNHHVNSEKVVAVTHEAYFDSLIAGFFSLNLFCLFIKINIFNDALSLYCYIITIITLYREVELSMQVFSHTITKQNTYESVVHSLYSCTAQYTARYLLFTRSLITNNST